MVLSAGSQAHGIVDDEPMQPLLRVPCVDQSFTGFDNGIESPHGTGAIVAPALVGELTQLFEQLGLRQHRYLRGSVRVIR